MGVNKMTKKEIKRIGLEVFENYMNNSEGINLETVKYLGAEKDYDCWNDYHDAWILWTCPELEAFEGDYLDFLEEHGLNYIEYVDTDKYTIQFCL